MKFRFVLSISVPLLMPAFAGAWQDDSAAYWHDNRSGRGSYDTSINSSGDGETQLQFDVQMRGSGDTDAYIYGTLGNGWDDVQIHRYDNRVMRSDHERHYRPVYRDRRWPSYEAGHGPAHYRPYPGSRAEQYPGQYSYPEQQPARNRSR